MSGLNSKEIKYLYSKGKKFYTSYFTVFFLPFEKLKFAVVVSKKISKKAVVRNKIKRRIRHLFTKYIKSGKYVVIVKSDISETDFRKIENDFKKIIKKNG